MDQLHTFSETVWARGWRDTKSAVHTIWFWAAEVGGGALTGLIHPALAALWAFGFFFAVWLVATAGALFRQRNEARVALKNAAELPLLDPLPSAQEAAQLMYDELTSGRFNDQGQILQAMKSLADDGKDIWTQIGPWFEDGINKSMVLACGFRENRSQLERIPSGVEAKPAPYTMQDSEGITWTLKKADRPFDHSYLEDLEG